MNALLGDIPDAHGGIASWNGYEKVEATIVSGGGFFPLKGVVQDSYPRHMKGRSIRGRLRQAARRAIIEAMETT